MALPPDAVNIGTGSLITVAALLALASLVPIVWAMVDLARRPGWQVRPGRKVAWVALLGIGWLFLWPAALVVAIMYLASLRHRLSAAPGPVPPGAPRPPSPPPIPPLPPPGWYPDPAGGTGQRWWNGTAWTEHTA